MNEEKRARLDRALSPKVAVVVGAKKAGNEYGQLRAIKELKGKVYSVQTDENEIPGILELGFENFKSLKDIPEDVDFVYCAVPRGPAVRFIVPDAIAKNVGGIVLYTSGFAETAYTGNFDGVQAQEYLRKLALDGDLNLIGPNCMGLYNPSVGLRFGAEQPLDDTAIGSVAFISQSGSQAGGFISEAHAHGIGMSKVVSFGNGIALHAADYLEYFLDDPQTTIIGAYLEGVTTSRYEQVEGADGTKTWESITEEGQGRRFFEILRKVAAVKPVVIWKGGITEDSTRATRSHTGSLAANATIWDAMVRQAGAISVHGLEEMADTIKALQYTQSLTGPRLGISAVAGGHSVEMADIFSREGLRVGDLSPESYAQLAPWFSVVGGSYRNPIEGGGNFGDEDNVIKILDILDNDPLVDAIVAEFGGGGGFARGIEAQLKRADTLVEWRKHGKKPLWIVHGGTLTRTDPENMKQVNARLAEGGIPSFHSFSRAARTLNKFVNYSRWKLGEE